MVWCSGAACASRTGVGNHRCGGAPAPPARAQCEKARSPGGRARAPPRETERAPPGGRLLRPRFGDLCLKVGRLMEPSPGGRIQQRPGQAVGGWGSCCMGVLILYVLRFYLVMYAEQRPGWVDADRPSTWGARGVAGNGQWQGTHGLEEATDGQRSGRRPSLSLQSGGVNRRTDFTHGRTDSRTELPRKSPHGG